MSQPPREAAVQGSGSAPGSVNCWQPRQAGLLLSHVVVRTGGSVFQPSSLTSSRQPTAAAVQCLSTYRAFACHMQVTGIIVQGLQRRNYKVIMGMEANSDLRAVFPNSFAREQFCSPPSASWGCGLPGERMGRRPGACGCLITCTAT